ncbi:wax ester/triacylglycerol synthase domain-containing protein [Saccharopolyspora phatthalungensis]|uniref:diacylglycerol O-acyltransferase n=1 Tax=Saccharopolyspora phatthalungensis TaxID=664693 RepID=A0A840QKV7_9PSEU|nr:wax ester/triacylglycerol synthase domain-containing protein [Saccharopolyspora phatthalungensis]MBB5159583.1 NRPS condensation-like uncharacterized protein [Saccharopolyspora phatthalungensis]
MGNSVTCDITLSPPSANPLTNIFLALDELVPNPVDMYFGFQLRMSKAPLSLDVLRERLAAPVSRLPQLTHRLVRRNGQARWERDEDFDIAHHVRAVRVAAAGPAQRLFDSAPDPNRPRWGLWLSTGNDGTWSLHYLAHHAVHDAISMLRTLELMFSDTVPAPYASGVTSAPAGWRSVPSLLPDLLKTYGPVTPWRAMEIPAEPGRRFTSRAIDLSRLRDVARSTGATINQVHLAAMSGALRDWYPGGSAAERLHALVPIDTRLPGEPDTGLGNQIGFLRTPLFTELPTARQRLNATMAATSRHRMAGHRRAYRALAEHGSEQLTGWVVKRFTAPFTTALTVSNVRISRPLHVFGTPVDEIVPLPWLPPGEACFTLASGYRDQFTLSALTHSGIDDAARLTDLWAQAVEELHGEFTG